MDLFSNHYEIQSLEQATRLLHESRTGFLTLFNNSPICMSMTTPQRTYKQVNKKFLEIFGYSEEEIIGHNSIEVGILDKEESARVGALIREKGRLQNDYVKCIAKDGSIVHTVSSIELMEMNGENYLISFFINITKIIEQQEVIEQHVQQLETVNKELEAFSYSVSHDLNAPLRAISGYSRLLEDKTFGNLNEEGMEILMSIQNNAKKMGNLIEALLSFARLGKKSITKTELNMNELVKEVLAEFEEAASHHAEIKVSALEKVAGDPGLMKQVWTNLISNAIKYSSKKEKPVVEISSERNNNLVVYTVKDNGEGFNMHYADKLFGVFQRLHTNEEYEGTGVGLATVQRIIDKHGGKITANAEVGKGAIFSFTLPA